MNGRFPFARAKRSKPSGGGNQQQAEGGGDESESSGGRTGGGGGWFSGWSLGYSSKKKIDNVTSEGGGDSSSSSSSSPSSFEEAEMSDGDWENLQKVFDVEGHVAAAAEAAAATEIDGTVVRRPHSLVIFFARLMNT